MDRIISSQHTPVFAQQLQKTGKRIVMVGGVFDILHQGHILFLDEAKQLGDSLIILLESDSDVKKKKGENRPIHTQKDRALVLAHLRIVDAVILLPEHATEQVYREMTLLLKPAIIATTQGDTHRTDKELCAALVGADVVDVVPRIEHASTSRIAKLLHQEL